MIDKKAAGRLKLIYKDFDGNQIDFAKLLGISQSSVSRMMAGEQPITLDVIKELQTKLGYDPMWIVNGTGPAKMQEQKTSLITDIKNLHAEIELLKARVTGLEKHL